MRQDYKKNTLAALKRLDGLSKKLKEMIDEDVYCAELLQIVLAMQGHLRHIQGHILESHLHTCAEKKLTSRSSAEKDAFIAELVSIIGLSKRS